MYYHARTSCVSSVIVLTFAKNVDAEQISYFFGYFSFLLFFLQKNSIHFISPGKKYLWFFR